ncbi:MAG: hypothetical protein H6849_00915 [Alphaproteobacteria bacterium]|nr:MAG: hypothetical protein H6849_00915 [Alphaproteobacteria bacterium]
MNRKKHENFVRRVYRSIENETDVESVSLPTRRLDRFDHWLTGTEYQQELFMAFRQVKSNHHFLESYLELENKFTNFYADLFALDKPYLVFTEDSSSKSYDMFFQEERDLRSFKTKIISSLREEERYDFMFPGLGVLSTGYNDISTYLYFENEKEINQIEILANQHELYLLK